ncbi:hypothetical protein [Methylobacterium longum]|uniref:Uncharacterized protein n=1 Tax=Methylobacterium longum TaxID=767694 RepID=A0ABT8AZN8_9HYPH|nr:hypothetical protein [Methylobacterium longum]MDN3575067.1 hypothetical protein [Methylobacterium longum]GJE14789.1 hypothetical protein FOHLNKBM_5864 [Methylobacterium longum]
MAYDQSGGANPSQKEREAGERAGRKLLGENGCPQAWPSPEQQHAADRTKMTVKHSLKRGSQEAERTAGEK